ncbi:hypothetical protein Q0590_27130 [Rhodocytophaga aerolata]|uniref:Uncharacterized protein n=1 Tax=Rhodocytophaga aerolata TaxID=455078 RepID=A0ABT8RFP8_9BACT|nr:hypothetical protein [Rhodocytophaga aerolata]MDO1449983.1 hypothetical protein [Rhodocytophaga aerolata]
MRAIFYLFLFLLSLSCEQQIKTERQSNAGDINNISTIIEAVILQDSLDLAIPIAEEIMPFIYLPVQLDAEEMELPPPPYRKHGIHYMNEIMIARNFQESEQYYLTHLDTLHIKEQLLKPKAISLLKGAIADADIFSIEAARKQNGKKVDACYIFSVPIFSYDSAFVYVQYDYLPVDLSAYGRSIILSKQNHKWRIVAGAPTWMH